MSYDLCIISALFIRSSLLSTGFPDKKDPKPHRPCALVAKTTARWTHHLPTEMPDQWGYDGMFWGFWGYVWLWKQIEGPSFWYIPSDVWWILDLFGSLASVEGMEDSQDILSPFCRVPWHCSMYDACINGLGDSENTDDRASSTEGQRTQNFV